MGLLPLSLSLSLYLIFIFQTIAAPSSAAMVVKPQVGVCYGTLGNNLPSPAKSVQLLQKLNAKQVKIYSADDKILNAMKGTGIRVTVMVPNELIINISSSQTLADQWVQTNVVPFYPDTMIRFILVGNEVLSDYFRPLWFYLVPAIRKIRSSIQRFGLNKKVKVGTPLAMDVLQGSSVFLPSNATFRSDISEKVMKPLLQFLSHTNSFFFIDLYPYFEWTSKPDIISIQYALLEPHNSSYRDSGSGLVYTSLLDQMLDSLVFSMNKLGYPDIRLYIAETGWPNGGDIDQIGANIYNAATYNRNVVKKFTAKPPLALGTPARPGEVIPMNIFALYNENQKPGPSTERHFGLLYPNGSYVYDIDLSGETPDSPYGPLPQPKNNTPYKGKVWCVIAKGANFSQLAGAIASLCAENNSNKKHICRAIKPGKKCYRPDSLILHASYVFSSYWAHFRKNGTSCFFNGLAVQTTKDPSYLSCKFPSVTL